jgi:hypothetical protein
VQKKMIASARFVCDKRRMPATNPPKTAKVVFGYLQLETALAAVFGVEPADQTKWFRGRIQHLRRLGLTPPAGRGTVVAYNSEWAAKWLIALEMEYFRSDPRMIAEWIPKVWDPPKARKASEAVNRGEGSLREIVKVARAATESDDHVILTVGFGLVSQLPTVGYTTVNGMLSIGHWLAGDRDDQTRRVAVFDLTARLQALDEALAAPPKPEPPEPPRPTGLAAQTIPAGKRRRGETR